MLALYRRAFSGLPRDVWLVSLVALVNRSGTMVVPFLALYLTQQLNYTPSDAGLMVGVYGVGALGGSFGGGWLADRFGARRVMEASLALQGAGFVVLPWVEEKPSLVAALVLLGLFGEAFRPASATALMLSAPAAIRTRAFSLLRFAINLGMSVGPTIGGLLAATGYHWLFWIDGATCLAAAAIVRVTSSRQDDARPAPVGPAGSSPWTDRPFLALIAAQFLVCLVFFQIVSTYPLTLADVFGLSEWRIGVTLAANALLIAIFEMIAVQALERWRALVLCGLGAALVGVGFGLTPFAPSYAWLLVTLVVWTAGEILNLPFVAAVVAGRAGHRRMGSYMGVLNLSFAFAFIVAPLLGGWAYEHLGARSLGVAALALCAAAAPAFWALDRRFRASSA